MLMPPQTTAGASSFRGSTDALVVLKSAAMVRGARSRAGCTSSTGSGGEDAIDQECGSCLSPSSGRTSRTHRRYKHFGRSMSNSGARSGAPPSIQPMRLLTSIRASYPTPISADRDG
jgi:hypothetical protein